MRHPVMLIALMAVNWASAQKDIDPTPQDVETAQKIRAQYAKDDVAVLESTDMIGFGRNGDAGKVTVSHRVREKLMNIGHRADIKKYEFYDSASRIDQIFVQYRNNKKAGFAVRDEIYHTDDLFYHDARVKYIDVDFPVQGYTYQYTLEKTYADVKYFTALYFNDEFPVLHKKIEITVPDWLEVELKEFNFDGFPIEKSTRRLESERATVYTFEASDLAAFHKEAQSPGKSHLYPHLLVLAKSFQNNGKETVLFRSAADLYKWYKSLVDAMTDDPEVFRSKVAELTAGATSDEEKIKNIYYWVQDNIRYIAFEDGIAGFKPDESQHVFQKRYGDCKGMANLIRQMLLVAGFDARLTWIGTKHLSYDYTTPSLAVDNHMICTVFHKGKTYFLDGTEKYSALGVNAERIQGKEVMIENGEAFIIARIPTGTANSNAETFNAQLTIENEKLTGTCRRTYAGESCAEFLYGYHQFKTDMKERALERYLSRADKNIGIQKVTTSALFERDKPLKIDYAVSVDNKVSSFGDEMYLDVNILREFRHLELRDRKTDYQFDYKTHYSGSVSVTLPAGYKVVKLPADFSVSGSGYQLDVRFTATPGAIVCTKSFAMRDGVIRAAEMPQWNAAIKALNELYNQQIILHKI